MAATVPDTATGARTPTFEQVAESCCRRRSGNLAEHLCTHAQIPTARARTGPRLLQSILVV